MGRLRWQDFKNGERRNAVSHRFELCAVETCRANARGGNAPDHKRLCKAHGEVWAFERESYRLDDIPEDEAFAIWCGNTAREEEEPDELAVCFP